MSSLEKAKIEHSEDCKEAVMSAIKDDIVHIVATFMNVRDVDVKEKTGLYKDLKMNSFELDEVMEEIGSRFNISIMDDEWKHVSTVGDIIKTVERKVMKRDGKH